MSYIVISIIRQVFKLYLSILFQEYIGFCVYVCNRFVCGLKWVDKYFQCCCMEISSEVGFGRLWMTTLPVSTIRQFCQVVCVVHLSMPLSLVGRVRTTFLGRISPLMAQTAAWHTIGQPVTILHCRISSESYKSWSVFVATHDWGLLPAEMTSLMQKVLQKGEFESDWWKSVLLCWCLVSTTLAMHQTSIAPGRWGVFFLGIGLT